MPGQAITLQFDQGSTAHLIMKDANGVVTTDLGTYSAPVWTVDHPEIVAIAFDAAHPQSVPFEAATPAVAGVAVVTVAMTSSDPGTHPELTDSFTVTVVAPPIGPVASIELTLDPAGPRLF